jgi:hypothetical protein
MTDWPNRQLVVDGWWFLFHSLEANDVEATSYLLHGLDNLQHAFWGDWWTTDKFPDDAAAHIDALLGPLVAIRGTFAPFIHEQEAAEWAAWSDKVDVLVAIRNNSEYSDLEKLTLIAGDALQGVAPVGDRPDGVPLVTVPFTLIRTSKQWHDADKWWHDIVDALAEIDKLNLLGLDRLGEMIPKAINTTLWVVGGLVAAALAAVLLVNSSK